MEYTIRRNMNRGYMRPEVWNEARESFTSVHLSLSKIERIHFRPRGQLLDATQSINANIAEGCCRRSINEYLQFLNVAPGSTGEAMTRMIGLEKTGYKTHGQFEQFDRSHYSPENKLVALARSLQAKRRSGDWQDEFEEQTHDHSH